MALTDAWLKINANRPVQRDYEKVDRDGLSVRISPKGKITFQIRYRHAGKPGRLKIGTYPAMTLKQARDENVRLRGLLDDGHNPKLVKASEKDKALSARTFETTFTNWFKEFRFKKVKKADDYLRSFEIHVFPQVGKIPPNKIDAIDWLTLFGKVAEKYPSIAIRIISESKMFYRYATRFGIVEHNPIADVSPRHDFDIVKGVASRNLDDLEIEWMWLAMNLTKVSEKNRILYKLLLLTGCRTQELRLGEKKHFDMEKRIWTAPSVLSKNDKPVIRPIIDEWVPLLEKAFAISGNSKYVFTHNRKNRPVTHSTIASVSLRYIHFIRTRLKMNMDHWTPHDLRRTCRTKLSRYTLPHIAEKMVGHTLEGNMKVYDQYIYLDEQRAAYTALANEIKQIVGEI